jgi:asparagine synthetase B (glutamine-hydrolysing)
MRKHFSLSLKKQLPPVLNLPPNLFPPDFTVKTNRYLCAGYFIGYNIQLSPEEIYQHCLAEHWDYLTQLIADFLIIFYDSQEQILRILPGQTGAFPCYFSLENEQFLASTDFGLVKNGLSILTPDLDYIFDYLALSLLLKDTTVFKEIHQVPPGTLLQVDKNFQFTLTPLVDINSFLVGNPEPFASADEFTEALISLLTEVIGEKLAAGADLPFAADISSGLDVNLVDYLLKKKFKMNFTCYSRITRFAKKDTRFEVMMDFVEKHDLKIKVLKAEEFFPFSTKHELEWITKHCQVPIF